MNKNLISEINSAPILQTVTDVKLLSGGEKSGGILLKFFTQSCAKQKLIARASPTNALTIHMLWELMRRALAPLIVCEVSSAHVFFRGPV